MNKEEIIKVLEKHSINPYTEFHKIGVLQDDFEDVAEEILSIQQNEDEVEKCKICGAWISVQDKICNCCKTVRDENYSFETGV